MPLPVDLIPPSRAALSYSGNTNTSGRMTGPGNLPYVGWEVDQQRSIPLSYSKMTACSCQVSYSLPSWPSKVSADTLDYAVDCTSWLKNGADTLGPFSVMVEPEGLDILWPTVMRNPDTGRVYAVVCLSGGSTGQTYTITFLLTTLLGRTRTTAIQLPVNTLWSQKRHRGGISLPDGTPVAPNSLQTPDGSILTLGPSVTSLVSTTRLVTVDDRRHLTTPSGRPLLDAEYQAHTDILLIA
ncbi:phage fiber-tail adaptor protein [Acetobacter senegalensis]